MKTYSTQKKERRQKRFICKRERRGDCGKKGQGEENERRSVETSFEWGKGGKG